MCNVAPCLARLLLSDRFRSNTDIIGAINLHVTSTEKYDLIEPSLISEQLVG